jgi:hypothetical protein
MFGSGAVLTLTAVGGSRLIAPMSAAAQADALSTRMRFVQLDSDQDKVEVHLNGDEKLDEFKYGKISDWIDVDPGAVRVTITEDRVGFNYTIFDAVYPILAGNDYNIIISDALVINSIVDRSEVPDDQARVRVTHAAVDLPSVNVIASGADADLATQLIYGGTSDYTLVPAGSYDVTVNAAETGEEIFSAPGIELEGNKTYDLVIAGQTDSEDHPLTIVSLDDDTLERESATPTGA